MTNNATTVHEYGPNNRLVRGRGWSSDAAQPRPVGYIDAKNKVFDNGGEIWPHNSHGLPGLDLLDSDARCPELVEAYQDDASDADILPADCRLSVVDSEHLVEDDGELLVVTLLPGFQFTEDEQPAMPTRPRNYRQRKQPVCPTAPPVSPAPVVYKDIRRLKSAQLMAQALLRRTMRVGP